MAADGAELLVDYAKNCLHGLVVGDALRIVAADDTLEFVGGLNGLLLHNIVALDDAQHYLWRYDRKTGNLFVGKEFV